MPSKPRPTMHARCAQRCSLPRSEEIFNSIVAGMAREGLIQNGSWVDAGANDGSTACFFADLTESAVHAIDPSAANVEAIRRLSSGCRLDNLRGGT